MDQLLDVVIEPDLSWRWKDEDELIEAVAFGLLSTCQGEAICAEGERAIERLEARKPPFCDGWEEWQPEPGWKLPTLPADWNRLP